MRAILLPCLAFGLTACTTQSVVHLPTSAYPQPTPALAMPGDGGIYNPSTARLFFETQLAKRVGDAVTVTIDENLTSTYAEASDDKANGKNTITGPGALNTMPGLVKQLFNVDTDASYSLADKSDHSHKNNSKVNGSVMVSVLDVLPNGYLTVGGDKAMLINGKEVAVRFSGIINPANLQAGNSISSRYVINARLDQINQQMPMDASVLAWMNFLFSAALYAY